MKAKTNGERMAVMETKLDIVQSDTHEIKTMIKEHIEICDAKYSAKWVENVTKGIMVTVVAGVIFLLIQLI